MYRMSVSGEHDLLVFYAVRWKLHDICPSRQLELRKVSSENKSKSNENFLTCFHTIKLESQKKYDFLPSLVISSQEQQIQRVHN